MTMSPGLPRTIALLGGTTTLGDSAVGMRYLIDRRQLVAGPAIAEFEQAFARAVGARHASSFWAGRVGLYGLLRAMGVGEGDEVLLQAPTHIVVANAVRYTGARPVFVDCDPRNYNMDLALAEQRITPRTKVMLLQHSFGIPVDLDAALRLARRHGLKVIEDCVHALGARYCGQPIGSFGDAAFFSTEETKTISTTMGGLVVTNDDELARQMKTFQAQCAWPTTSLAARYVLKLMVYHLQTWPYIHWYVRWVYKRILKRRNPLPRATTSGELAGERPPDYEQRLSNAQAAIGLRQLQRLEENLAHRRRIASLYVERLADSGMRLPHVLPGAEPAYVRFPVWVPDRSAAYLSAGRYAVLGIWFSSVLEESHSPTLGGYEMGSCPQAEELTRHLVNLPTHPRVTLRDVEAIVAAVRRAAK